eukprot:5954920-Pleurochrysis_carterae.AAC.2
MLVVAFNGLRLASLVLGRTASFTLVCRHCSGWEKCSTYVHTFCAVAGLHAALYARDVPTQVSHPESVCAPYKCCQQTPDAGSRWVRRAGGVVRRRASGRLLVGSVLLWVRKWLPV